MAAKRNLVIISITLTSIVLGLIISLGVLGPIPLTNIRPLGLLYALFMANKNITIEMFPLIANPSSFWAASTEAITAILWDYRGLDTLFETSVFFFAIIGSIALFRFTEKEEHEIKKETRGSSTNMDKSKDLGLSLITKTITKIIFFVIVVVSAAIALHGQLTPGGGFQGGSALAVAPLLAIAALSRFYLDDIGFKKNTMLLLRTIGLLIIALLAIIPVIAGIGTWQAYVMQNQPKEWATLQLFPPRGLGVLLGSLVYYNIAELLAVGAGFTIIFILLSIPEEFYKKIIEREGEEHG